MFAEILKITIPALMVFLAGYLALRILIKNETQRQKSELMFNTIKITLPMRLQAYERLILFLERISPESILVRVNKKGMLASDFQNSLLGNIRAEWEHNLSQQLYVSKEAWELVKNAKENIISLINISSEKVAPNDSSFELSRKILETFSELDANPTTIAIDFLKKEVKNILD
ncbi:MAG: hypothetical protein PWR03_1029 [Tenuifilum sp.]|jgi:hypothetical protein|uniref:Uncharacterized protein n=1 Tax=Tenuifilum thalassicum TaxID=2590900 RepID=A0A7D4C9A6_9BACT|nr:MULTISPECIES: hypothetical protein [Tenuifilum]MDI3526846.1 hypothetical protein [Tenuifilum sp.]QKG80162.1 hypothetical protein FHG85_07785 [Tenuifilum thalassicum]